MAESELRKYWNLRDRDLRREGLFAVEGRLAVERFLVSGLPVESILCAERFAETFQARAGNEYPVMVQSETAMQEILGFKFHRGVVAMGARPAQPSLAEFVGKSADSLRMVICPEINDAENIGSIVRSARAFGFHGIALGEACADPLSRKAIRSSAGAILGFPVVRLPPPDEAVSVLRSNGVRTIAGVAPAQAVGGNPGQPGGALNKVALILGSESMGIGARWLELCDAGVTIPISAEVDSLNVGVAAGILLHALSVDPSLTFEDPYISFRGP